MSSDLLEMELEPGPWEGDQYVDSWPISGTIRGCVRCRPNDPIRARSVRVSVGWRTEGRGSTNKKIVDQITVHEGDLEAAQNYEWPFELRLPEEPISYEGHLIRIIWEVTASVDIRFGRDPETKRAISVLPDYVTS